MLLVDQASGTAVLTDHKRESHITCAYRLDSRSLTNSFANFLAPSFAAHLSPYILIPGAVEIVLALWLLFMGVNAERWKEQARAARERS